MVSKRTMGGSLLLTLALVVSSCGSQTPTTKQQVQAQANGNLQVYYKKPTAWGNANIHYWNTV
ncbi:hypothetical protein, partial [Deinococcus roseus]|uniref:hypothetical protein n=1 Tax=Deinococcus roseus TaxID=392414 RepID=UPI001664B3BE